MVPEERFPIGLGVVKLDGRASWTSATPGRETGLVLLSGEGEVRVRDQRTSVRRGSLFEGPGHAWLVPPGAELELSGPGEWAVVRTPNSEAFDPVHIPPESCRSEARGRGQHHDCAFRWVRTYVDRADGPAQARLVLGEVHTLAGRWSSYPPHHHAQPEVYHYRFEDPRGYGHAEHGEAVGKVRNLDTLCIDGGRVHAQCAAPGYDMFYLWAIRHLDGAPYDVPTFDPQHCWILGK